jgi:hypothetical protein
MMYRKDFNGVKFTLKKEEESRTNLVDYDNTDFYAAKHGSDCSCSDCRQKKLIQTAGWGEKNKLDLI